MKKVLHVSELFEDKKEEKALKPIKFTHCLNGIKGWVNTKTDPSCCQKVVYLGMCNVDGDLFVAYTNIGHILFYKGHLNDGVIE